MEDRESAMGQVGCGEVRLPRLLILSTYRLQHSADHIISLLGCDSLHVHKKVLQTLLTDGILHAKGHAKGRGLAAGVFYQRHGSCCVRHAGILIVISILYFQSRSIARMCGC
jgi:hypothetical protein